MVIVQTKDNDSKVLSSYGVQKYHIGRELGPNGNVKYGWYITIHKEATHNCQMSTVGGVSQMLAGSKPAEIDKIIELLSEKVQTRCMIVDIYDRYKDMFIKALEKADHEIVFKADYRNTTGSDMTIIYVDVHTDWESEDDDDDGWDDEYYDEDDE